MALYTLGFFKCLHRQKYNGLRSGERGGCISKTAFICCCEGCVGEGLTERRKAHKGKIHASSTHMTQEVKENIQGIISNVSQENCDMALTECAVFVQAKRRHSEHIL
jgi:hypothetical protein